MLAGGCYLGHCAAGGDILARLPPPCGYKLKVALPPELPEGILWEKLQLTAIPAGDSAEQRTLIVELTGDVEGPLVYYGTKIDRFKVIHFGTLQAGQAPGRSLP